ncbi:MAG TPA: transglycosylase domain-containing protein [Gammaproteobacteria bacterium]|nr:transglycosylase domain-containing protein [Gammaproteobacteria bacterium]
MGEHTIREVLKRRSSATQRELQKRREQGMRERRSRVPLLVLTAIVLILVAAAVYGGIQVRNVSGRFVQDLAQQSAHPASSINLQSATAFLPNSVLAILDPSFYDASATTLSPVTQGLVQVYFPEASGIGLRVMITSLQLRFNRSAILEAYINDVPMGSDHGKPVIGLAAASQAYFRKPFAQLQPQEIALLVAMMRAPDTLDPRRFPDKALAARNAVLQADAQQTVLSQDQADLLSKLPLGVVP